MDFLTARQMDAYLRSTFAANSAGWSTRLDPMPDTPTEYAWSMQASTKFDAEGQRKKALCDVTIDSKSALLEFHVEGQATYFRIVKGSYPHVLTSDAPWHYLQPNDDAIGIARTALGSYNLSSPSVYVKEPGDEELQFPRYRRIPIQNECLPLSVPKRKTVFELDVYEGKVRSISGLALGHLVLELHAEEPPTAETVSPISTNQISEQQLTIRESIHEEIVRQIVDDTDLDDFFGL